MKKFISFVLALISLFTIVTANTDFANAVEIEPRLNNTNSASVSLGISSSGKATASLVCIGIDGVTTKIIAETKIERKWGLLWLDVDGAEWTYTVYNKYMSTSHSIQLSKTGTYRAKTKFTVSGSGGSNDVIESVSTSIYD